MGSVLRQTFRDYEILVVDDGSTDGTPDKLRASNLPAISILSCNRGGPARARNVAISRAAGRFLAFLDSDDLWLPHHLAEAHRLIQIRPERRFLFSDARFVRAAGARGSYLAGKTLEGVPHGKEGLWRLFERCIYPELIDEPTIATSSVIVDRTVVQELGGFNEQLNPFGEDTDLWLRISLRSEAAGHWEVGVERRKLGDNLVSSGQDLLRLSKEIEMLEAHYERHGRSFRPRIRRRLAKVYCERSLAAARKHMGGRSILDMYRALRSSPSALALELHAHLLRRVWGRQRRNP
jgi:glycosyltransferase involved in cell wall biosynthesis